MLEIDQIMVAEGSGSQTDDVKFETISNTEYDDYPMSTADTVDADIFITKESGGWVRKAASKIWNYIKGKADAVYAAVGHTHNLSLATDSGTSAITLVANTKYKLTSGGKTLIFTTPSDNATDNTKVAKAGDTMTGSLTFSAATLNAIKYAGTKATNNMIKFKDNTSNTYGNGIIIGGCGLTIIGSGESPDTVAAQYSSGEPEEMIVSGDGAVYILTNVNGGYDNRKTFTFGTDGKLTAAGFVGALTGNADTATKLGTATKGATGQPIYLNAGAPTACTRLDNAKWLTNEAVSSPGYVVGLTSSWGTFGYTTIAQLKSTLALNNVTNNAQLPLAGGTMTGRITSNKPNTSIITGSGTAAQDKGSGVSPRYFPAKWTFNTGITAQNGDIIHIKIPVAGHSYGVYVSIDNGTKYYPVVTNGTSRLTTHFGNGTYIMLQLDTSASAASIYPLAGGDATTTVTGGAWRVVNYYDSNTTYSITQYTTDAPADLAAFVTATAKGTLFCDLRFKDTNNVLGFGASAWIRGYIQYQNAADGSNGVCGNGIMYTQENKFYKVFINGTTSYTLTKTEITNTDAKVKQSVAGDTYNKWRPLIIGSSSNATEGFTPTEVTDGVYASQNISCQPSTGTIKATTFKGALSGNASTATKLGTSTVGGTTTPIYLNGGVPTALGYTIAKSVPSNAKFTDTWTALVGATSSANGTGGYISAVPPSDGYNRKFFRADGAWAKPAPSVNVAKYVATSGSTVNAHSYKNVTFGYDHSGTPSGIPMGIAGYNTSSYYLVFGMIEPFRYIATPTSLNAIIVNPTTTSYSYSTNAYITVYFLVF